MNGCSQHRSVHTWLDAHSYRASRASPAFCSTPCFVPAGTAEQDRQPQHSLPLEATSGGKPSAGRSEAELEAPVCTQAQTRSDACRHPCLRTAPRTALPGPAEPHSCSAGPAKRNTVSRQGNNETVIALFNNRYKVPLRQSLPVPFPT